MTELAPRTEPAERRTPPRVVATILAVVGIGMLSMSFAAVPLYRLICETTGMGGTPRRVTRSLRHQGRPHGDGALRCQHRRPH